MNSIRQHLATGHVIPALPLALDAEGTWSRRYQRALVRYYLEAGAGGIAVGVHSTQFEIRDPEVALFEPVLRLAAETIAAEARAPVARIAGVCGDTEQALVEAELARSLGYDAALLSLAALGEASEDHLIEHCRAVGEVIPLIGFYLQPAVGGRVLPLSFWRRFVTLPSVVAIKVAPFNRYQTGDVVRAVAESGRDDITLYTGNDDNIIGDLLTPFPYGNGERYFAGGLLGQWGVGTRAAVQLLREIQEARREPTLARDWLKRNAALTDVNAAVFDAANGFTGCIPGILEVLRRQGLVPSSRTLNPKETLSPGQAGELDRVHTAYPEYCDDEFIETHRDSWLTEETPWNESS